MLSDKVLYRLFQIFLWIYNYTLAIFSKATISLRHALMAETHGGRGHVPQTLVKQGIKLY